MQNITLWWACPWTLSVAAVQAGGLGMVALGAIGMIAARSGARRARPGGLALRLCVGGLLGVFLVGYPGYFVFDGIWPGYYYAPVVTAKNVWLLGQGAFIAVFLAGAIIEFVAVDRLLRIATTISQEGAA
ncbi:MAG: hypothetical protein ACT6U0_07060 [Shinella sp.]|uniref:hypothetical protein n=1 Tax=Shinella sp. TaxID=1870904 RepID=UPI0040357204